jgi:hypothetical protein
MTNQSVETRSQRYYRENKEYFVNYNIIRRGKRKIDHVKGVKISNISNLIHHGSKKQLLEEILKCELVCALCHRIRTHDRKHK